ncbi:MAG: hypothetical protein ACFFAY_01735 [Promethearchaeota archaeon]
MALEIPASIVGYLVLAIPLIAVCLIVLIHPWLKNEREGKWKNYVTYLVRPLPLKSFNPRNSGEMSEAELKDYRTDQLAVRIAMAYIVIIVFIIASTIGVFYYVASDILIPVSQGSTGLQARISSILIATPFSGGWYGALPWYTSYPTPHYTMDLLHEPWQWVFHTAVFTDNPVFFDSKSASMILLNLICSVFFLVPLAVKSVRKSFVPSIFFLITGMLVMMRGIFGFTAMAFGLEYGSAILRIGAITYNGSHPHGIGVLLFGVPVVLVMSLVFAFLAHKIWRVHYPENTTSSKWFVITVLLVYWGSLLVLVPF